MKITFAIALLLSIVSESGAMKIGRHRHHHHRHNYELAQDYSGTGNNAWVDDCSTGRDLNDAVYGSGTQGAPDANGKGSFDKVGIDCQGFA